MAIQVNIDGVNKTVIQPKVNIGGTWKTVNVVSHNIDGVWKESFRLLTIKIYRYGSIYQTLTVVKGNSVKLPSLGVGYATSSSSTTTTYGSGATITPTTDLNLYAVFSYSVKLYKYGSLYNTLTSKSQSSSATFTLPTCTVDSGDDSFYGWTTTSGSTTRNYQSGASVTTSGMTLYAIFKYTKSTTTVTNEEVTVCGSTSGSGMTGTYTVGEAGTITFYAYTQTQKNYQMGGTNSSTNDGITLSSSSNVTISVNGSYLTGSVSDTKSITKSVSAGDTITVYAAVGSATHTGSSSVQYTTVVLHYGILTYPKATTTTETAYRSTK